jgi:hypothetical protein
MWGEEGRQKEVPVAVCLILQLLAQRKSISVLFVIQQTEHKFCINLPHFLHIRFKCVRACTRGGGLSGRRPRKIEIKKHKFRRHDDIKSQMKSTTKIS